MESLIGTRTRLEVECSNLLRPLTSVEDLSDWNLCGPSPTEATELEERTVSSQSSVCFWMSWCLLAFMLERTGQGQVAQDVLVQAERACAAAVAQEEPLLLTGVWLCLVFMHMYDQTELVDRVMAHVGKVVCRDGGPPELDPIRSSILYVVLTAHPDWAGERLDRAGFTNGKLHQLHLDICGRHGAASYPAITARYNHCWRLRHAGEYLGAVAVAHPGLALSTERFGLRHPQTIALQTTIAGCYRSIPDHGTVACHFSREAAGAVAATMGTIHPWTLEVQRRYAMDLQHVPGQEELVVATTRLVTFGRMVSLGSRHVFTIAQLEDYEQLLDQQTNGPQEALTLLSRRQELSRMRAEPERVWGQLPREPGMRSIILDLNRFEPNALML